MGRYQALFEEGLIAPEVYRDLAGGVADARAPKLRRASTSASTPSNSSPVSTCSRGSTGSTSRACARLLRPRFTVPNELIVRKGERGDAVFFIASGAAEVALPGRRIPLGSGDVFGEMALLTGEPRQGDVRALTYCRLLVLRKADFDRFMRDNRDVRSRIDQIAETRLSSNRSDAAAATS